MFATAVQMTRMSALVGTPHIIWRCRIFSSTMAPTHTETVATACAADVAVAMPDVAVWMAAVTIVVISIGD